MNRQFVCAAVMTLAMFSIAVAEEFTAIITKVEDGKITFTKFDFKEKKKGEPETLPTVKDVKVVRAKFNKEEMKVEAGDAIEEGLKNDMFKDIKEAKKDGKKFGGGGLFATIITDSDNKNIKEIRVFAFNKKKKKDN